jgi:hypothetical protein
MVRWPSWLWRQVKVTLTHIPGHESGVGSSPTLISIRLASVRYPRFFFFFSQSNDSDAEICAIDHNRNLASTGGGSFDD